ncbi:hypothetical protein [Bacillus sp. J14TS2]|uniref:hypothetical protein n=1 Tax=Bacillus sp. J14TS2 TaxID=2807188 RepID=UPI001BB34DE6|nr:hypothetical protein [Bacillus sp. J14TS2]
MFEVDHVDNLPQGHRRPYIVVCCIDEFVMLRKDEDIMDILTEIVAVGRTLGVFAILSMQRPNAQVIEKDNGRRDIDSSYLSGVWEGKCV